MIRPHNPYLFYSPPIPALPGLKGPFCETSHFSGLTASAQAAAPGLARHMSQVAVMARVTRVTGTPTRA